MRVKPYLLDLAEGSPEVRSREKVLGSWRCRRAVQGSEIINRAQSKLIDRTTRNRW